jgi:hypothetical protein
MATLTAGSWTEEGLLGPNRFLPTVGSVSLRLIEIIQLLMHKSIIKDNGRDIMLFYY